MVQQVYLKADNNVYKFGITCNPERRHKDHQRTNPDIVHYASFYVKDRETAKHAEDILRELTGDIRAYGREWCVLDHDVMTTAWNQVFEMFEDESEEVHADWEWDDDSPHKSKWVRDGAFFEICIGVLIALVPMLCAAFF